MHFQILSWGLRAHISPSHTDTVISHYFFLPAVEPFLVIYDRHVSFSLELLYFERPDEQGKRSGWMEALPPEGKQSQEVGGLSHVPNCATFVLCTSALPQVMQGFAATEASSEAAALTTVIAKQLGHTEGKTASTNQPTNHRGTCWMEIKLTYVGVRLSNGLQFAAARS